FCCCYSPVVTLALGVVERKVIHKSTYDLPKDTFWTYFSLKQENFWDFSDCIEKLCKDVVLNKKLITKLQESRFDVILADAIGACAELLAELLKTPFVYSLHFFPGYTFEKYSGGLPLPPSYHLMRRRRPTTLSELMGNAELWLIRTNWDFEFPHPFLPHFEFVGGLHCKPAKSLPQRFEGKKPDSLGPNTQLRKWIPQNDLLGHPKTKAFITHGGTNGIYEAIYHGIPMVGIPLFVDQPDNIAHMKAKGAAVKLDFNTMSSADLLNALKTVINDPLYKENAMKLSRIHHDQPMKPLDRAAFWIEPKTLLKSGYMLLNCSFLKIVHSLKTRRPTLSELMKKAEMWLSQTFWDFEFPHQLLPSFQFVEGLHCKPASGGLNKVLYLGDFGNKLFLAIISMVFATLLLFYDGANLCQQEMQDFVQSSGENDIVVFTLGSIVINITEERASVLWRFDGKKPDTLGPNTRLCKWILQNDLLGHQDTKAFIIHGGTNSIYGVIYHGIPMLGILLLADQRDNSAHTKTKGATVRLDLNTMSSSDLLSALKIGFNDLLNDILSQINFLSILASLYFSFRHKENAVKLSRIHHDQPVKLLD
ncbi:hypothetical protein HPG69_001436, partial [Diceros bicornis minor]